MTSDKDIQARMGQLMVIIDQTLMLCDNEQDQLMLACAMLQRTTEIFDDILGEEGRKKMFKDMV
jgi:hypothetical protein